MWHLSAYKLQTLEFELMLIEHLQNNKSTMLLEMGVDHLSLVTEKTLLKDLITDPGKTKEFKEFNRSMYYFVIHKTSSCPNLPSPCDHNNALQNPGPNYQTLYGALVGGPGIADDYVDDRGEYAIIFIIYVIHKYGK